jgi:peptidoglycan/LPS O-acetylase OafA/YrhL
MDKLAQYLRSRPQVVVLGFVITLLLSAFSWQFFESPILKLKLESPAPKFKTA